MFSNKKQTLPPTPLAPTVSTAELLAAMQNAAKNLREATDARYAAALEEAAKQKGGRREK